jgi:hypothetical protein
MNAKGKVKSAKYQIRLGVVLHPLHFSFFTLNFQLF